jgi:hypothetical protein
MTGIAACGDVAAGVGVELAARAAYQGLTAPSAMIASAAAKTDLLVTAHLVE